MPLFWCLWRAVHIGIDKGIPTKVVYPGSRAKKLWEAPYAHKTC